MTLYNLGDGYQHLKGLHGVRTQKTRYKEQTPSAPVRSIGTWERSRALTPRVGEHRRRRRQALFCVVIVAMSCQAFAKINLKNGMNVYWIQLAHNWDRWLEKR
jgi:hypothetical protein